MQRPLAFALAVLAAAAAPAAPPVPDPEISAAELREHLKVLAGDAFEGRRAGTPGAEAAADYVAARFAEAGLRPAGDDGTFLSSFDLPERVPAAARCRLAFRAGGAAPTPLGLGDGFVPFSFSADGSLAGAEVVFVGHGIRSERLRRDDYAGAEVRGKVVAVLRRGPAGLTHGATNHDLAFETKARAAQVAGAAGVLFLDDRVANPGAAGRCPTRVPVRGGALAIPVVYLKPAAADALFAAAGLDPSALEQERDAARPPPPRPLAGVRLDLVVGLAASRTENVVGLLPGADPARAGEAVVLGAHYDHLGTDGAGGLDAAGGDGVWNGADDNASGTAGLIELAEHFALASPRPARTMVFVAFAAEELGLLGSSDYVKRPAVPLLKTAAMLNLDMIGRGRNGSLFLGGTGTSPAFGPLLDAAEKDSGLALHREPSGFAPSDSLPFANARIPTLFFFAGIHPDYHRTSDEWDRVDADGMVRILRFAARVARAVADLPEQPAYAEAAAGRRAGPYLGITPDFSAGGPGVLVERVMAGSPAASAGLLDGDRIVQLGAEAVDDAGDLIRLVGGRKPGDVVEVVVLRGGDALSLSVTLAGR